MGKKKDLAAIVDTSGYVEELFDLIPNVVFFVKDIESRYRMVNTTLVERCGLGAKTELLGRTASDVFPSPLGDRYLEQDRSVVRSATPIGQKLELHLYPNRLEGWCLTDKLPLIGGDGRVVGVAGISRDLQTPTPHGEGYERLARAMELIQSDPSNPLTVAEIARRVGFSTYQLNRRLKNLLGITARQLLTKTRIDIASELLRRTSMAIGDVAQQSGYCDQSAFTRQFRRTTGLTPRQYRQRHHPAS
jgi:AraC-like DNA-binding protein